MVDIKIEDPNLARAVEAYLCRQDQGPFYPIGSRIFDQRSFETIVKGYSTAYQLNLPRNFVDIISGNRNTTEVIGFVSLEDAKTREHLQTLVTGSPRAIRHIERGIGRSLRPRRFAGLPTPRVLIQGLRPSR